MNQLLLEKLKKQVSALGTLRFKDGEDVKFLDWLHKTKLLILFLSFEKKEEYLRKELIAMLEDCVHKMPKDRFSEWKVRESKEELQGLLKSIIEILELRENFLDEENQQPKKSNKK